MRFMMLMIPKGYENADAGHDAGRRGRRGDDEVQRSRCRRPACCWRSTACIRRRWARASRSPGGKPKVTDGPFAEAKEVLGGYWMIQVKSKEEAIEWASRCPGVGQRGDRGPPGAGVRGLPGRRAGGRGRIRTRCRRRSGQRTRVVTP